MMLRLGNGVEVVGIGAEIDECCWAVGIFPGDDKDGIVGGTFGGPLGEHYSIIKRVASGVIEDEA